MFPIEDEKLRATSHTRRRGGNCANTLEVLTQLVSEIAVDHCDASYGPEAPISVPQLHLLTVLPEGTSEDVALVGESLKNVGIVKSCIFRQGTRHAAASYIIQNTANNTRTIISHNPLPEMTAHEFVVSSQELLNAGAEQGWYHFEGRVPELLLSCVEHLRLNHPRFKISVECEKPERTAMLLVAKRADVVFFSRLWAEVCPDYQLLETNTDKTQSKGYKNPVRIWLYGRRLSPTRL
jgi:ketohexokinase